MEKVSKIWYVGLGLTVVMLLFARLWLHRTASEGVKPLETFAAWTSSRIVPRATALFRAQAVIDENRRLRDEMARLRVDASLMEEVAVENAALRTEAAIPPRSRLHAERCVVISRGGSGGWWRSIRLGKGRFSGIRPGDAVVAPEGLVGYVASVTDTSSDVRLLTDPSCRISCVLDEAGDAPARGILQGCGWNSRGNEDIAEFLYVAEPLRVDYLPLAVGDRQGMDVQITDNREQIIDNRNGAPGAQIVDSRYSTDPSTLQRGGEAAASTSSTAPYVGASTAFSQARALVKTSGLSETIPGGIMVGWLVSEGVDPDGLYRMGQVLPAVDFADLSSVFVLTSQGGGR